MLQHELAQVKAAQPQPDELMDKLTRAESQIDRLQTREKEMQSS